LSREAIASDGGAIAFDSGEFRLRPNGWARVIWLAPGARLLRPPIRRSDWENGDWEGMPRSPRRIRKTGPADRGLRSVKSLETVRLNKSARKLSLLIDDPGVTCSYR